MSQKQKLRQSNSLEHARINLLQFSLNHRVTDQHEIFTFKK